MSQLGSVVRFLRTISNMEELTQESDEGLLARFISDHDQAAFSVLVKRHGPMIMAVCRRILGDHHQAEDAAQATFLVLARKASSIKYRQSLASWLFGVATRTALKARSLRKHDRRARPLEEVLGRDCTDELLWTDLRSVLDEEINRLPEKYRAPFVLCYLAGRTNAAAATVLQCPQGTVVTRLARARARLQKRLSQRGVTLSLPAFGQTLDRCLVPAECSPQSFLDLATQALKFGFGAGAVEKAAQLNSAILAKGILKTMFLSKLKIAALSVVGLMALVGGAAGYQRLVTAQSSVSSVLDKAPTPAPEYPPPPSPSQEGAQPPPPPGGFAKGIPPGAESPGPVALTTYFTPVFEGGAIGEPIPFTIEIKGLPAEYASQVLKQIPGPFPIQDAKNQQAAKDFQTAEFYEKTAHPDSAYFYYEIVCRRYPGTEQAKRAAQRKEELLYSFMPEHASKATKPWEKR